MPANLPGGPLRRARDRDGLLIEDKRCEGEGQRKEAGRGERGRGASITLDDLANAIGEPGNSFLPRFFQLNLSGGRVTSWTIRDINIMVPGSHLILFILRWTLL